MGLVLIYLMTFEACIKIASRTHQECTKPKSNQKKAPQKARLHLKKYRLFRKNHLLGIHHAAIHKQRVIIHPIGEAAVGKNNMPITPGSELNPIDERPLSVVDVHVRLPLCSTALCKVQVNGDLRHLVLC